jgi:hypothetical protein
MRFRDSGRRFKSKNHHGYVSQTGAILGAGYPPKGQKDNQDDLLDDIVARLKARKTRMAPRKVGQPSGYALGIPSITRMQQ